MSDIAEFLRTRLAEARAEESPHGRDCDSVPDALSCCGSEDCDCGDRVYPCSCPWPSRVLADVDAKLSIVARHARCGSMVGYCDDGGHGWDDVQGGGCGDLGDLAVPFAKHPDYDQRWTP